MTESIAYEASKKAEQAMILLHSHEAVCTERWTQSRKATDELKDAVQAQGEHLTESIEKLWNRLWVAAGALITVLIGILVAVLLK